MIRAFILVLMAAPALLAQCGVLTVNPLTHKFDCTGPVSSATGTVTSVDGSAGNGVETIQGGVAAAITTAGTVRGNMPVRIVTGTTDTILTTDRGKLVTYSNGSAIAVTLPQSASPNFAAGFYFCAASRGVGTVTITPTTSTIDGSASVALVTSRGLCVFADGTNYYTMRGMGVTQAYATVEDEATPVTQRSTINFTGAGVTVADTGGKSTVTIPGVSSGAWLPSNPTASAPPALSNWTSTTGGGTTTTADVTGGVLLKYANSGDNSLSQLSVATPGASGSAFTITAHLTAFCYGEAHVVSVGIMAADAGNAKVVSLNNGNSSGNQFIRVSYITNTTTPTSDPVGPQVSGVWPVWLRLSYGGTGGNFVFQISPTGTDSDTWSTFGTLAANAWLAGAPARIGFFVYPQLSTSPCTAVLDYWLVTQP